MMKPKPFHYKCCNRIIEIFELDTKILIAHKETNRR